VVLLDVTIPGASSREVLAEVRRALPRVKVVVTSAYGQNTVDATFPGMEIDFFLVSPTRWETSSAPSVACSPQRARAGSRQWGPFDPGRLNIYSVARPETCILPSGRSRPGGTLWTAKILSM
jgi:hypothetical protein